ncbi:AraC family transcriptional regulator [Acinetobacter sp. DSM 11652]|uniref:AraC family transcriptional regulator n=1 Tax=Acinetobacter sp. DSM 11652 TaxID=346222 RepID=UPI0008C43278|nr:AraC family transcriptional regulator [Acinetobacter sp. DSM 11652]SEL42389.1 AraC-type DNA-binding protein [Acinetobacter sp. DSM 11652]
MDALSQVFEDIHLKNTEYLYLQAQGKWAFELSHQTAMITYILLYGEAFFKFQNGEQLHLKAGDMAIIPSGMSHQAYSHQEQTLVNITQIDHLFKGLRDDEIILGDEDDKSEKSLIFSIRSNMDSIMGGPLIQALPTYIHLNNALNAREPEWLRIGLYFVADETKMNRPGRHKIMDHVVSIMLIECVRDYISTLTDQNNWLNALTHPELSPAFSAIHSQPERNWTVESLAETCFMSRSKFAHLFQNMVNETPLAYLQKHRLRLASQLLRLSQLSIQQIAHKVGYSSETAFSQAFKKHYLCSPSQYRNTYLN